MFENYQQKIHYLLEKYVEKCVLHSHKYHLWRLPNVAHKGETESRFTLNAPGHSVRPLGLRPSCTRSIISHLQQTHNL